MKILIFGSSGFLGKYMLDTLKKENKFKIYNNGIREKKTNLTNKIFFKNIIYKIRPDIIINCAAISNVDICEKNPKLSKKINLDLVKNIVNLKKKLKFYFIHFSTDQIYNPKKNIKNKENKSYKPLNIYSKHKIYSESLCIKNSSLVFRINLIGKSLSKKNSFTDIIFKKLKNKEKILGFSDSVYSPLNVLTLSNIIKKILKAKKYKITGLFNLGSVGKISKYNLIIKFSKIIKLYNPNNISRENINNLCYAKRSNYNAMNINKFQKFFKINLPLLSKEIKKTASQYV